MAIYACIFTYVVICIDEVNKIYGPILHALGVRCGLHGPAEIQNSREILHKVYVAYEHSGIESHFRESLLLHHDKLAKVTVLRQEPDGVEPLLELTGAKTGEDREYCGNEKNYKLAGNREDDFCV